MKRINHWEGTEKEKTKGTIFFFLNVDLSNVGAYKRHNTETFSIYYNYITICTVYIVLLLTADHQQPRHYTPHEAITQV